LWILEDQGRKLNRPKKVKERKRIPLNPEARKPQKLMDQSPLTLTVRIRISHCFGDLAATYAEKTLYTDNSQGRSPCWPSWSAVIFQINTKISKTPIKEIYYKIHKKNTCVP